LKKLIPFGAGGLLETPGSGAGRLPAEGLLGQIGFTQSILENMTLALVITDPQERCIYMNPAAEKMTGFRLEEVRDVSLHLIWHTPLSQCPTQKSVNTGKTVYEPEMTFIHKDKSLYPVKATVTPIAEKGRIVALLHELRDLAPEKHLLRQLKEVEESFTEAMGDISLMFAAWDQFANLIFVSKSWMEYTGLSQEDTLKTGLMERIHPDEREEVTNQWRDAFAQRKPFNGEHRIRRSDGEYRWFYMACAPHFTQEGEFAGFNASMLDIHERKLAELAFSDSEMQFKQLYDSSILGIISWDSDGSIRKANDAFLKMLGYTREEFEEKGLNWRDLLPKEYTSDSDIDMFEQLEVKGAFGPQEKQYRRNDGQMVDLRIYATVSPESKSQGVAFILDISHRKQFERALQESEAKFRHLSESGLLGILFCNANGVIYEANEAACSMIGYTQDEIAAGKVHWDSITPPEFLEDDLAHIRKVLEQGTIKPYEKQLLTKSGQHLDVLLGYALLPNSFDNLVCFMVDITERKNAERLLQQSEKRFRHIADNSPVMLWTANSEGKVNFINKTWLEFTGLTPEESLGTGWRKSAFHPDDAEKLWNTFQHAWETQQSYTFEGRLQYKQPGQYRWTLSTAVPWFLPNGDFAGFIGSVIDIDERKDWELSLQESEQRFRSIAESAPIMFWIADPSGSVKFVSKGWLDFSGLSQEEAMGDGWLKTFTAEGREELRADYQQIIAQRNSLTKEMQILDAQGAEHWVLLTITPNFLRPKGKLIGFIGAMTDITSRKKEEYALKESEKYFRQIVDETSVMLWITDTEGMTNFVSKGLIDYFGLEENAFKGMGWIKAFHPDEQETIRQVYLDAIRSRTFYNVEARAQTKDGEYRWVLDSGRPRFNEHGEFMGFIGTVVDIHERKEAILALERSEAYFRQIVNATPIMLWMTDTAGSANFFSKGLLEYFGLDEAEMSGLNWMNAFHPEDRESLREKYLESIHNRTIYNIEARARTKSGEYRWILDSGRPLYTEHGEYIGFIGTVTDIHERKEAILALERSEAYFRYIVDTSPIMLWMGEADGTATFISKGMSEYCGIPTEELLGRNWLNLLHPETRDEVYKKLLACFKQRNENTVEILLRNKAGEYRWVSNRWQPRYNLKGEFIGFIGMLTDIHEQKEAMLALESSEAYFRSIVDASPIMLWISGTDGKTTFVSKGLADYLGCEKEEFLGDKWLKTLHPEDMPAFYAEFMEHVRKQEVYSTEFRIKTKNQGYRWVLDYGKPRYNEATGEFLGFIGTITDITEHKEAELRIRESEEYFRRIADVSPVMLWISEPDGNISFASQGYAHYFGFDKKDFLGMGWLEMLHPDDVNVSTEIYMEHHRQRKPYTMEYRARNKAGEYRWYMDFGQPRYDTKGRYIGFIGTITDITERKEAELRIRESEIRFRMMADAAPVFIWLSNAQGEVEYFNKQLLDFLGMSQEEILEKGYLQRVHPDDREELLKMVDELKKSPVPFHSEIRMYSPVLQEYRWLYYNAVPRFTGDTFLGYAGSSIDITDYKRAQESVQSYAKRLEQSNRELEEFATIASHDLQAPLRKISMFSNYIEKSAYDILPNESKDYFDRILKSVYRMQRLLTDLLELSRVTRKGQPFRPVSLNQVIDEVLSDLQYLVLNTQGRVEVEPLCEVTADPMQMHQLFQNLIGNALKFHKPDVPPLVRIYKEKIDKRECSIILEDNGIGFSPEQAERIFDPFVRLPGAESFEGTGMGLAICRKIIERHGGSITASGEQGVGSRFTIRLPRVH
jgi:PAS domain S-box-containing protein